MLTKLMGCYPGSKDFSSDLVMKDRFGAGGRHVYKFKTGQGENMLAVIRRNSNVSYIIQPFAKFDQGFSYRNLPASTDIRLIYLKGEIVQSYIRVAKSGDFRCNEHQGGLLTYLSLAEIPPALVAKSNMIAKILNKNAHFLHWILLSVITATLIYWKVTPGRVLIGICLLNKTKSKLKN